MDTDSPEACSLLLETCIYLENHKTKNGLISNFNGEIAAEDAISEQRKIICMRVDANVNSYSPAWHTLIFRFKLPLF